MRFLCGSKKRGSIQDDEKGQAVVGDEDPATAVDGQVAGVVELDTAAQAGAEPVEELALGGVHLDHLAAAVENVEVAEAIGCEGFGAFPVALDHRPFPPAVVAEAADLPGLAIEQEQTSLAIEGQVFEVELPIDGEMYRAVLRPHSVRAENFRILRAQGDGSFEEVEPGPVRTVRGEIAGLAGATIAGELGEDGLTAQVVLADGTKHVVEPLVTHVVGAGFEEHAVYLALGDTPARRRAAYRELFQQPVAWLALARIRHCTEQGWALGDGGFLDRVSTLGARRADPLPRGGDRRPDLVALSPGAR